jgi:hypothetical protein
MKYSKENRKKKMIWARYLFKVLKFHHLSKGSHLPRLILLEPALRILKIKNKLSRLVKNCTSKLKRQNI